MDQYECHAIGMQVCRESNRYWPMSNEIVGTSGISDVNINMLSKISTHYNMCQWKKDLVSVIINGCSSVLRILWTACLDLVEFDLKDQWRELEVTGFKLSATHTKFKMTNATQRRSRAWKENTKPSLHQSHQILLSLLFRQDARNSTTKKILSTRPLSFRSFRYPRQTS